MNKKWWIMIILLVIIIIALILGLALKNKKTTENVILGENTHVISDETASQTEMFDCLDEETFDECVERIEQEEASQ